MHLVRFEGLRTERYETKIRNAVAVVIKTKICHHFEVQGESGECDNMKNRNDHICESLDLQRTKGLNFADESC